MTQEVQDLLGARAGGADITTPLANALAAVVADDEAANSALDALVSALNAGPAPNALSDVILPAVHIEWSTAFQEQMGGDWRFGSARARAELLKLVWGKAFALRETSPEKAGRYARAALIFSAQDTFPHGGVAFSGLVTSREAGEKLSRVPGRTDAQREALWELNQRQAQARGRFMSEFINAAKAIERIRAEPAGETDQTLLDAALDGLDAVASPEAFHAYMRIHAAWQLRNLLNARNDRAGVEAINVMLQRWKDKLDDANGKRWCTEALQRTAKPTVLYAESEVRPGDPPVPGCCAIPGGPGCA